MVGGRKLFAASVGVVVCTGATPGLAATQSTVDCGSGGNLQAAISAAKPGTIISVSGTCHGTFTVGKNLVLKGVSAAVLDAQHAGTTLTVTAGKVRVTGMTITGGEADVAGIRNSGTLTLLRDAVTGNVASGDGTDTAGIENHGTLIVQRSTLTQNHGDDTGGILNTGTATVEQSTIGLNAIAITNTGSLALTDSTVYRNTGTYIGGIDNSGTLTVLRSTIANNLADNGHGAGIVNAPDGTVTVVQSTIAGNVADEAGGGLLNEGSMTIKASIVAGNSRDLGDEPTDCANPQAIISGGYNVFGTPCAGAVSTDRMGTFEQPLDAMLKVLGDYGGKTMTMVPRPGSPAVNVIPIGAAGGLCPSSGSTDQRGIPRPQAGACDVGSVERKPKS
jgi:hypothetical protein